MTFSTTWEPSRLHQIPLAEAPFCGRNPSPWDTSQAGHRGSQVVNTVSTVLVGHLGARDLAAVGLAVSLANVTGYSATRR